jgi:hypothetical protein
VLLEAFDFAAQDIVECHHSCEQQSLPAVHFDRAEPTLRVGLAAAAGTAFATQATFVLVEKVGDQRARHEGDGAAIGAVARF